MRKYTSIILVAFLICPQYFLYGAEVLKVFAKKGNIYISQKGKKRIQLTGSGKDRAPVLSPDGKVVVFIRESKEEAYSPTGGGEDGRPGFADQLWIVDIYGKNEKMLVKDRYPNESSEADITRELEKTIGYIDDNNICFSPDGKVVYFISSAWVTSGALHRVNVDGTGERFIEGANSVEVVPRGEYKGDLIISQHRYFLACGSYDWLWLFTPEGKEVGPLGEDLNKDQRDFLYSERIK